MLGNSEIGYLVYAVKEKNEELLELLDNMKGYSSIKTIMVILKAYSSQKMNSLLASHFNSTQINHLREQEHLNNTPIHAAFLNWMVLGNLQDLLSILE